MSDDFFDIGWEEMAIIGSLSETLADEERERRKLERETERDERNSCCEEADPCDPQDDPLDPPDEDPYP